MSSQEIQMAVDMYHLKVWLDNASHPAKISPITISDRYVRWLYTHHHAAKEYPDNEALQRLQEVDNRTSQYARLLLIPTSWRKIGPVHTAHLATQLEQSAEC
jgi:hypothetical protein